MRGSVLLASWGGGIEISDDLRRTAVRNMRRAGVSQVIRMKTGGHKTDSMERRYNIADLEDPNSAHELDGAHDVWSKLVAHCNDAENRETRRYRHPY